MRRLPGERRYKNAVFCRLIAVTQRYSLLQHWRLLIDARPGQKMQDESDGKHSAGANETNEFPRRTPADLVALGGHLHGIVADMVQRHVAIVADTPSHRRNAARLCFCFFETAMGVSTARARAYIRCHHKFGDDPAATKVFTFGELNILAAKHITGEHITAMVRVKGENPGMTRQEFTAHLNSLTENDGETSDDASAALKLLTGARSHDRPNNAAQ